MKIFNSLISAFSMYSKIPMPQIEWKEENRRYALCFFPLIGAVIGGLFLLWKYICDRLGIGNFLFGAVSAFIPIIVTGGIHIDGFCDVIDARSSYGSKEKKLEIMDDPHVGSFAIIYLCIYFILQTALFCEINDQGTAIIIACGYVLSRALSGIAAVSFKNAKGDGLLHNFSVPAHKKINVGVIVTIIILICAAMTLGSVMTGISAALGALLCFLYYRISSYKIFGGITGDLAGWFLQLCEIAVLAFAVIGEKITEVLFI